MTKPNMKPYDPAHTGEFCYAGHDTFVRILCTDAAGKCPIKTLTKDGGVINHFDNGKCSGYPPHDLMCVIPKREARVLYVDTHNMTAFSRETELRRPYREVMPDDISQERAQAVIEAARRVRDTQFGQGEPFRDALDTLRAAMLGDDA